MTEGPLGAALVALAADAGLLVPALAADAGLLVPAEDVDVFLLPPHPATVAPSRVVISSETISA